MANTTISTILATTAVLALAACGGGGSGSGGGSTGGGNNPTLFGALPNQELRILTSNQDGSGVASAYRSNTSYLIYSDDVSELDLNSQANIDINALTTVDEGMDYIVLDGTYVGVTSRQVVRLFLEQLWFEFVPFLHRLQGRLAAQG